MTAQLVSAARAKRDRRWGRRITYSPKVFLPVTNLCRNVCDYCAFRKSPKQAHTMAPDEIDQQLARAKALGCVEALLCLGDRPEAGVPSYRRQLAAWGHSTTVSYLVDVSRRALALGLVPHTNAGVLAKDEMAALAPYNASLGLMLESVSERLCEKGMPHHRAPDKRPAVRLQMLEEAGELRIPFTTGILVGIGETEEERVEALVAIRASHRRHGHVQEVIVQPFRPHAGTPMAGAEACPDEVLARAIALARLILDEDVTVQAPPNLAPLELMLDAGINDLGGISPLTPDFINVAHAWPHIGRLSGELAALGFELAPRMPVHAAFAHLAPPSVLEVAGAALAGGTP